MKHLRLELTQGGTGIPFDPPYFYGVLGTINGRPAPMPRWYFRLARQLRARR
jgi:hypothetical protein